MTKLIICLSGKPLIHGYKRREFTWSADHGCYLYKGREFECHEFNEIVDKVMRSNEDMHPSVKVVQLSDKPIALAPIATISAREITVAEAEEVLFRMAPHRLKGKTGPKPRLLEDVG